MRTLIVGDIHGCALELNILLKKFNPQENDKIIALGDLINKGPDSFGVIQTLKKFKANAILGNHDYRFLENYENIKKYPYFEKYTQKQLKIIYDYLSELPFIIETPDFYCVHAGFDTTKTTNIKAGLPKDFLAIREVKYQQKIRPWFDFYKSTQKHIFFGHWAKLGLFFGSNITCLDGGCVYGKKLCGYIFEEKKLLQVKAQQVYCPIVKE